MKHNFPKIDCAGVRGAALEGLRALGLPDLPTKENRMADTVETILTERNTTHGSFADNARISQELKRLMHSAPCWNGLHDVHKESLHMIAMKISRILSGHADFNDHWDDAAGYAKLASAACGRRR